MARTSRAWSFALVLLLLPCVTALSALPCTRTLRHFPRATARCELNEIGETSQTTRSLVSSLTALVNAMSGSAPPPAPRERAQASLDGATMLAGLRADFEEHEYLWSGKITAELYDEDCVFTDPTLSFGGLATFERNLANLDPWIERFVPPGARSCELKKIELLDARGMLKACLGGVTACYPSRLGPAWAIWRTPEEHLSRSDTSGNVAHCTPLNTQDGAAIVAEWRMVGDLALPWRPRLDLDGRTRYTLGGEGGRISSYDEAWAITPSEALWMLVKPFSKD